MENLKKKLSKISGGKILDVGTGRGQFINLLKDSLKDYTEIIGIDTMQQAIDFCNKKFNEENIHFLKMDAMNMSYEDNTFDTVCLSNSLHHLPHMIELLQEMKRVLKPNGLFIISEMFCDNQTEEQMSHVLVHHWSSKIDTSLGLYHDETFTRNKIIDIFKQLNLKNIDIFDFKYKNDNPKSDDIINYFDDVIDKVIERVKDKNNYENLKKEGLKIKEYIKKHGFQSATELFLMGQK